MSQKLTAIRVFDETGGRVWRGQCVTDPERIKRAVKGYAGEDARIGIETGHLLSLGIGVKRIVFSCEGHASVRDRRDGRHMMRLA